MPDAPTGSAFDDEAIEVHLFLCLENGHYAVTTDLVGTNLPAAACPTGWKHIDTIALGAREALPFPANPEPAIRAIGKTGFYIFDSGLPHGTSQ